jgi:hypothetical protein
MVYDPTLGDKLIRFEPSRNRRDKNDLLKTTRAADIEMSGLDWLWPNRFARGKFALIAGMPDMGKGQIAAYIAAACTANIELPCNEGLAPQGK